MNKTKATTYAMVLCAVLLCCLLAIPIIPIQEGNSQLVLNNDFSIAETTYTNKTMYFTTGDPYNSYSYWTLSGGGAQGPSDGFYTMDVDAGEYEFFGFDEFVDHSLLNATVEFRPLPPGSGTWTYICLAYFYQKTALNDSTHWALAVIWNGTGMYLLYNTANGETPSSTFLDNSEDWDDTYFYEIELENFGILTSVLIERVVGTVRTTIYNGAIQTGSYDARDLYAGFGDICTVGINAWCRWDDFSIIDTILDAPTNGYGFSLVNGYIDEVLTHTFYDIATGYNSTLSIDSTVTNITLVIQCWLNGTTFDIDSVSEGANIIRHNVTVTNTNKTVMFSQSNFTYSWGIEYDTNIFVYQYWVELDFTVVMGEIYTALLSMEVYYPEVIE